MSFKIFHYLDEQARDEFKAWEDKLQAIHRAKLRQKIDKLMLYGDTLHPHMLTDSGVSGIQKLRVQGSVKLRPLLCRGPLNVFLEYTFLKGAKEIGSRWEPKNARIVAKERKQEVVADPVNRRTERGKIV